MFCVFAVAAAQKIAKSFVVFVNVYIHIYIAIRDILLVLVLVWRKEGISVSEYKEKNIICIENTCVALKCSWEHATARYPPG